MSYSLTFINKNPTKNCCRGLELEWPDLDLFLNFVITFSEVDNAQHLFLTYSSLEEGADRLKHVYSMSCNQAETALSNKEEILEALYVKTCTMYQYKESFALNIKSLTTNALQLVFQIWA